MRKIYLKNFENKLKNTKKIWKSFSNRYRHLRFQGLSITCTVFSFDRKPVYK